MSLERGPLSLVSTNDELLERKNSGSGPESREYGRRDPSRWPRGTLYPQKLALISPTNGGCLVGIVRLRTQATEFSFSCMPRSSYISCFPDETCRSRGELIAWLADGKLKRADKCTAMECIHVA
jgi:hypothetical protein